MKFLIKIVEVKVLDAVKIVLYQEKLHHNYNLQFTLGAACHGSVSYQLSLPLQTAVFFF